MTRPESLDAEGYRRVIVVERFFKPVKNWRGLASSYDKLGVVFRQRRPRRERRLAALTRETRPSSRRDREGREDRGLLGKPRSDSCRHEQQRCLRGRVAYRWQENLRRSTRRPDNGQSGAGAP